MELERGRSKEGREKEARRGEITRVQYIKCRRKDTIGGRVLE